MSQRLEYHVDVVFVIDATNSMTPVLRMVQESALTFHGRLMRVLSGQGKHVDRLRLRVVTFRDLRDDGVNGLAASPFFTLPQESAEFSSWVVSIQLIGNTTYPESGLAGLSVALQSPWTSGGSKRRHVIVLWTDDAPHLPEHEVAFVPPAFRSTVAASFDELTDAWESSQYVSLDSRRLVLFAPDKGAWPTLAQHWTNTILYPSRAGLGISDYDIRQILDAIASSV